LHLADLFQSLTDMLYIHRAACISPQQSFPDTEIDLLQLHPSAENKLKALEPSYEGIPPGLLRRMGKTVRLGIGAALSLLREAATLPDGILIGTANAGMEESIQFMKEITDYEEGILSPGAFVQSTPNTIAAQLSLLTRNKAYNITHVQGGLAFENALTDAVMLLRESASHANPGSQKLYPTYLVGAADEIGKHNYNIDRLQGWFKTEPVSSLDLYTVDSPGSLAGEGAAMFLVSDQKENAMAGLEGLVMLHSEDPAVVGERLHSFLDQYLPPGEKIDLLLSGENGDNRSHPFCTSCENVLRKVSEDSVVIARFKHMCGEYPTASAFALWLACQLLGNHPPPSHMLKRPSGKTEFKRVLICNSHKGSQHSFMLVSIGN
jgi:Beta-ketoacyl synthase, N-terminal domain